MPSWKSSIFLDEVLAGDFVLSAHVTFGMCVGVALLELNLAAPLLLAVGRYHS